MAELDRDRDSSITAASRITVKCSVQEVINPSALSLMFPSHRPVPLLSLSRSTLPKTHEPRGEPGQPVPSLCSLPAAVPAHSDESMGNLRQCWTSSYPLGGPSSPAGLLPALWEWTGLISSSQPAHLPFLECRGQKRISKHSCWQMCLSKCN